MNRKGAAPPSPQMKVSAAWDQIEELGAGMVTEIHRQLGIFFHYHARLVEAKHHRRGLEGSTQAQPMCNK